jgi:hypothetical protein
LISTFFRVNVVLFKGFLGYNSVVNKQKGEITMNTDKIYAEKIASEYAPKETSKIIALKKLDSRAKLGANIFAYSFGIGSTLVFGTGMCLAMGQIGPGGIGGMIAGVVLGVIGMIAASVTYPVYKKLIENGKKKYGNDILRLAREISEG